MRLPNNTFLLVIVAVAVTILLFFPWKGEAFNTWSLDRKATSQPGRPTIFVSVASYRDEQCAKTLRDLYAKATHPERVFVGAVEQNSDAVTEQCLAGETPVPSKQIRRLSIPHTEAKGPCYARYLASTLFRGESLFMQIDSHTTFVPGWDEKVVNEINACPDPTKAIISMYPNDDKEYTTSTAQIPVMCGSKFNSEGLPIFEAAMKSPSYVGSKPRENAFIAGGFFCAPGRFVRDVPFDPSLDHLFQGEEILLSARAYTNGYNIYTPRVNVCLHAYNREESPKFWNDVNKDEYTRMKKQSESRARRILGLEEPAIEPGTDNFGLGTVRSITAFWNHAGINPGGKETDKMKFCK
jgi:hypothetical protein